MIAFARVCFQLLLHEFAISIIDATLVPELNPKFNQCIDNGLFDIKHTKVKRTWVLKTLQKLRELINLECIKWALLFVFVFNSDTSIIHKQFPSNWFQMVRLFLYWSNGEKFRNQVYHSQLLLARRYYRPLFCSNVQCPTAFHHCQVKKLSNNNSLLWK